MEKEKKEAETKKIQEEESSQDYSKQLGKRPIIEYSPPPSPPKKTFKSLMIQHQKNPLLSFLKDCQDNLVPRISAIQLLKEENNFQTESSSTEILTDSSLDSSLEDESGKNLKRIAQAQLKVEAFLMMNQWQMQLNKENHHFKL